jgi:hypothetical protein
MTRPSLDNRFRTLNAVPADRDPDDSGAFSADVDWPGRASLHEPDPVPFECDNAPAAAAPAAERTRFDHVDGLGLEVHSVGDEINEKLAEIELSGEEAVASVAPTNTERRPALSAEARYLHISRTIHQLIADRNRAVGIYLFVASLLIGAGSALTSAGGSALRGGRVGELVGQMKDWCWPTTFGVLGVLGLFCGLLLIRSRVGLIYEVAKMNVIQGLPVGRVKRINPLSIFYILHMLISGLSGAAGGLCVYQVLYVFERPEAEFAAMISGAGIGLGLIVCYYMTVLYTTRAKALAGVGG